MKRWVPHLVLIGLALLQVALYHSRHRDIEALREAAAQGSPRERVAALHILTNRGPTPHLERKWDRAAITPMIGSGTDSLEDSLLADFAYTVDICRMAKPIWQDAKISARLKGNTLGEIKGESFIEWLRHFLLFRRKVAGRHMGAMLRLKNDEVRWLITAIAGDESAFDPQTQERILADIQQRQTQANMSRTKRMAPPDPEGKRARGEQRRSGQTKTSTPGAKLPGRR